MCGTIVAYVQGATDPFLHCCDIICIPYFSCIAIIETFAFVITYLYIICKKSSFRHEQPLRVRGGKIFNIETIFVHFLTIPCKEMIEDGILSSEKILIRFNRN